ncbi:preprotein translocase subunit YajC [Helicobacter sp. MIT 05-5293]|uniref:preprotein translocase subunit YajC n=1 Tax=Helicobacter sp. MIT 05-5293 TaxID=1548149 RepID=UPI00051D2DF8|nr:preprotein translocase subunit YajC [Helicobacter sp. MIT 05-5293]TLD80519.1 preprotein translocase subunit YajC [Helicobacter sp. MIT 05-5293]
MQGTGMQETLMSLLPIVFFIAIFYLLLIRPANVKRKKHQEMINALQKGDKIITTGGLICEIVKPEENFFSVRLNDDTVVKLSKEFIAYKVNADLTPAS